MDVPAGAAEQGDTAGEARVDGAAPPQGLADLLHFAGVSAAYRVLGLMGGRIVVVTPAISLSIPGPGSGAGLSQPFRSRACRVSRKALRNFLLSLAILKLNSRFRRFLRDPRTSTKNRKSPFLVSSFRHCILKSFQPFSRDAMLLPTGTVMPS